MMFCLNDMVVYPAFGVAKLSREVVKRIDGEEIFFYELTFVNKDVKILIPRDNINTVGIRELNKKENIEEILKGFFLAYSESWINEILLTSWNRRTKDYQSKIRCGEMKEIAKIYRDLKNIEKNKVLSFGEKAVLAQVEELLCEEISVVYGKDIEEVVLAIRRFTLNSLSNSLLSKKDLDDFNINNTDMNSIVFRYGVLEN
jgi:CarD family transcriptional regulator